MSIFGQPGSYSDILQRVFWSSLATGLGCTVVLAKASPAVGELVDSIQTEADLGPVKGLKVLYVLIPFVVALVSRIIKLHDRISDVARIRFIFDTQYMLFPLCRGAGVALTDARQASIRRNRVDAMYKTVYKYAGFEKPAIDTQRVRTAADNWGWFWVLTESSFLLAVSSIILAVLWAQPYMTGVLFVLLLVLILLLVQWRACVRSAKPQVDAILSDPGRKAAVQAYFSGL